MNRLPKLSHPAVDFLITYLRARVERVRSAEDMSRGASAVEWVVISAVVVTIVGVVTVIISRALKDKAGDVGDCIGNASDTGTC